MSLDDSNNQWAETLRESERRLRFISDHSPVLIVYSGVDKIYKFVNKPYAERFGLRPQDIVGKSLVEVLGEEAYASIEPYVETVLRGERVEYETQVPYHGLGPRYVWATYEPEFDDSGGVIGFVAAIIDITDRKLADEALAARERQLSLIYQSVADCLFVLSVEEEDCYRFVSINDAFLNITGFAREQVVGKQVEEVLPESSHALVISRYREAIRDNKTVQWEEVAEMPAGKRVGEVTITPMGEEIQGRRFLVGAVHDITALKAAEAVLRESDRRKDEFLAMLAHELRNPLAPIRNAVQLLRRLGPSEPEIQWTREVIDRQVEHLVRLVDDLLDVSRITQGKITLKKEKVDLITIIGRALETSRPLIDSCKHRLTVSLPEQPLRLEGDTTRLTQVVSNLLNNAAKFTPEGGQIWLVAEAQNGQVVLRVRDTGIGIAEDLLPQVFDLFRQADRSLDRSQGGLGIGLSLVRSLLEMHGGTVEAYSDGPGRGSEFVVRLPAFAESGQALADASAVESGLGNSACHRILVVDDNVDSAESIAVLLELNGHDVRMAYDGPAALEIAYGFHPQVVVLDIGLPGMDGYEVARRLRSEAQMQNIILIALTGYGQSEDRQQSLATGFNHHLVKPVDPEVLQTLISSHVRSGAEKLKRD